MSSVANPKLWDKARIALTSVPFKEGGMVIQLLEEPAFESWICWTVILKARVFTLKQVIWNMPTDVEHVRTLGTLVEPFTFSFDTMIVPLDMEKLEVLIEKGSKISIPLVNVSFGLGTDGITYTLSLRFFPRDISLTWWLDGPDAWHEFTAWAMELRTFFVEALPKANLPSNSEY